MGSQDLGKIFGDGPYPFPAEAINKVFDSFISKELSILITKGSLFLTGELGEHCHDSYEFTIFSNPQAMMIDNRKLWVDANVLVQINSGQSHGPNGTGQMQRMSGVLIDRDYLQSLARQIYSNSDFYFDSTSLSDTRELIRMMRTIIEEASSNRDGKLFMLEALCTQIAITLLRQAKNGKPTGRHNDKAYDKSGIKKVIDYFREHYDNNSYSFVEVADIANLSPYHLIRAFKRQTGKTPYEYLVDLKIEKAKELLENYRYSVTEICFLCGFNNHSHFTTLFKRKVGVPPSEYRNIVAPRVRI